MLRNKLNLFLLNLIIYLLYSVAANDSSGEEYNSEESEYSLLEDSDLLKVSRYIFNFLCNPSSSNAIGAECLVMVMVLVGKYRE
uniref:Uncharacterized protein n=1 Tax=Meloidogyne floridensis TaxID=298350 RepID=A0A915PGH9_9BILA